MFSYGEGVWGQLRLGRFLDTVMLTLYVLIAKKLAFLAMGLTLSRY